MASDQSPLLQVLVDPHAGRRSKRGGLWRPLAGCGRPLQLARQIDALMLLAGFVDLVFHDHPGDIADQPAEGHADTGRDRAARYTADHLAKLRGRHAGAASDEQYADDGDTRGSRHGPIRYATPNPQERQGRARGPLQVRARCGAELRRKARESSSRMAWSPLFP